MSRPPHSPIPRPYHAHHFDAHARYIDYPSHYHTRPHHHASTYVDAGHPRERNNMMPSTSAVAAENSIYASQPTTSNLPPSEQRPINMLVPEQQLQMANIHRFTPSCSRCRQKKLKCDTNLPCNQCIAKGIHDQCRKDPRIPRGRKRPKLVSDSSDKPQDEIASLRKRVKQLEEIMARHNRRSSPWQPPSPSASHLPSDKPSTLSRKLGTSSRGSHTTGPSEIGGSASRDAYSPSGPSTESDDDEPGETENSLATLEKLAASDPRISEPGHGKAATKQINNVLPTQIARDGPNTYYTQPALMHERVEVLMLAKRLIPDKHIVDTLIHTFNMRCHNLVGRIVHMPSFRSDVDYFNNATVEELLTSPLSMYHLSRYLMVLRLGMRFYPWKGGMFVDETSPEFIAVNALKNRGDDISLQWLNLAKRTLAADRTFSLGSLAAIQTALLMILDGRDSLTYLRMLLCISIQTALDMGLHRLGDAMPSPKNPEQDIVHLETGVRIWWYLVVKDWCSAQREGAYTVHPSQMTTRRPLHTTDARLSEGRTDEISLDEYCETSYTLCQIQLANIIRESIDLRNEQSTLGGAYNVISPNNKKLLHVKLETFLSDLPPFYRLESSEMLPGVLAVQRCLLHQQAFDVLLKLNRKSLSSYSERATCTLLAEQIVSTQKLLRSVCPVIDGFWVNFLHLFAATLTLTISLLLDEGVDAGMRDRRRGKVGLALTTMRETPGSDRGSRIIQVLLAEEEKRWQSQQQSPEEGKKRRPLDLASLTRRIVAQTSEDSKIPLKSAGGGRMIWDKTPDESVVPTFASSWGISDPTDPTGIISSFQPRINPSHAVYDGKVWAQDRRTRPYQHSLRPWAEPSPPQTGGAENQNSLWDWVFSQAALLGAVEPPIEGPPSQTQRSDGTNGGSDASGRREQEGPEFDKGRKHLYPSNRQ